MIVAIHQPAYFPWLGLVEKIALADHFVALDSVQFNARAFQHRTLYSTDAGVRYLTLPVHSSGCQALGTPIRDIALADPLAGRRHFKTLSQRYGRQRGWKLVEDRLRAILCGPATHLAPVALATLGLTLECFGIGTPMTLSSSLAARGTKSDLMISLTRAVGGTVYISGAGARAYMDPQAFARQGIAVTYQDFSHPVYAQGCRSAFQPGCFALEWFLLAPDEAVEGLRSSVHAARRRLAAA